MGDMKMTIIYEESSELPDDFDPEKFMNDIFGSISYTKLFVNGWILCDGWNVIDKDDV